MDIEELKIGDIALNDKSSKNNKRRQHVTSNHINARNGSEKQKCKSDLVNDQEILSQQSLPEGTHNSYNNDDIHFEPILDQNTLTKKTSAITDGRPPKQQQKIRTARDDQIYSKTEGKVKSSNDLNSSSLSSNNYS